MPSGKQFWAGNDVLIINKTNNRKSNFFIIIEVLGHKFTSFIRTLLIKINYLIFLDLPEIYYLKIIDKTKV